MRPAATAAPAWPRAWPALLAAGALQSLAFAPWQLWWLQPLGAAVLMAVVLRSAPRQAFLAALVFGLGWLGGGWWWLHISLHRYGGLNAGLAVAAVGLLALGMSLYLALAMALAARLRCGRPLVDALLLAAAWLLADLARGQWLTGFPWSAPGYAHTVGPLAALAPWVGVYGIGAVAGLASALVAQAALGARSWSIGGAAVAVAAALAAAHLGPRDFTRPTGPLRASLLQPAVAQDLKFDPARMQSDLQRLTQAMAEAPGPLVVTPESVVPLPQPALPPEVWERLRTPFLQGERAALLGIFLGDEARGYVNSMVGLAATPQAAEALDPAGFYAYGKRHLLPFGEFIPPGFGWFVALLDIPLGDQARGRTIEPFVTQGQRLRPLICYEDLFGEEIVASVVGPQAATVLVNASNLAWFGTVMVLDQHLQFSQMRALEFQRPFVRSTNTGATAAIDHRGRVLARLPAGQAGRLDVVVEGRSGETPYARWLSALGLMPLWFAGLAGIGVAAIARVGRRAGR